METSAQLRYLKIALVSVGAFCVVGVYPLTILWPSGWAWHAQGHSLYLQMIIRDLRDARRVPDHCGQASRRTPQPDLVHGLVKHRAWRDHGNPGVRIPGAPRASVRRCAGIAHCRRCFRVADSAEETNNIYREAERIAVPRPGMPRLVPGAECVLIREKSRCYCRGATGSCRTAYRGAPLTAGFITFSCTSCSGPA